MQSVLYIGAVEHTRYVPVYHQLRYPLYVYGIDLDELSALDRRLPLFGYNRFRPAAIHDRDYLDYGPERIRDKLERLLQRSEPDKAVARVVLITSARYFNYVFNPVSFYYCFAASGELAAVVAEVNNTFGERHVYIPEPLDSGPNREEQNGFHRFRAEKAFHVSPFNSVEGTYEFLFSELSPKLDIQIHLIRDGNAAFKARLTGRPVALTAGNHMKTLLRHPLTPHLTMLRILKEAARLRLGKKLPFQEKPRPFHPLTIRPYPDRLLKKPPETVGLLQDRLQPCPKRPNCVSSMTENGRRRISPILYNASLEEARERLLEVLYALPGIFPVTIRPRYLHAVCETRIMRFKDDLEFLFDEAGMRIHVRSASRTGYSDLGVNRRRLERIRALFHSRAAVSPDGPAGGSASAD
jgi:DUF1365 family protein